MVGERLANMQYVRDIFHNNVVDVEVSGRRRWVGQVSSTGGSKDVMQKIGNLGIYFNVALGKPLARSLNDQNSCICIAHIL